MSRAFLVVSALAVALGGCAPKPRTEVAQGEVPPFVAPEGGSVGGKGEQPAKPTDPKPADPAKPAAPITNPPIGGGQPPHTHGTMRTNDWQPARASALQVARDLDTRIASLANVRLHAHYRLLLPDTITNGSSQSMIQSPNTYMIEYLYVRDGIPKKAFVKADGARRGELKEGKPIEPGAPQPKGEHLGWQIKPVAAVVPAATGERAVSGWALGFQRAILAPIIDRSTPFASLLAALESGAGGYTVSIEERERLVRGNVVHNYRIVAERKGAAAKKLGESRIEIVSDAHLRLPVTIRVNEQKPGDKGPTRIVWTGAWSANQAFDGSQFKLPS